MQCLFGLFAFQKESNLKSENAKLLMQFQLLMREQQYSGFSSDGTNLSPFTNERAAKGFAEETALNSFTFASCAELVRLSHVISAMYHASVSSFVKSGLTAAYRALWDLSLGSLPQNWPHGRLSRNV